jgi:hypothetical protein
MTRTSRFTGIFWWCCGSVLTLDRLPASSLGETQQHCGTVGSNVCSVLCGCGGTPRVLLGSEGMRLWAVPRRHALL